MIPQLLDVSDEYHVGPKLGGKPPRRLAIFQCVGRNVLANQIVLEAAPVNDLNAAALRMKFRRNGISQLNRETRCGPGRRSEVCNEDGAAAGMTFGFIRPFEDASSEGLKLCAISWIRFGLVLRVLRKG